MKRSREDASPSVGPKEGDASPVDVDCKKDEAARGAAGDFDTRSDGGADKPSASPRASSLDSSPAKIAKIDNNKTDDQTTNNNNNSSSSAGAAEPDAVAAAAEVVAGPAPPPRAVAGPAASATAVVASPAAPATTVKVGADGGGAAGGGSAAGAGAATAAGSAGEAPPSDVEGVPNETLFVGNLSYKVSEAVIIKLFTPFGKVVREQFCYHMVGPRRGEPRGFCFVEYSNVADGAKAIRALHGRKLYGRPLRVRYMTVEGKGRMDYSTATAGKPSTFGSYGEGGAANIPPAAGAAGAAGVGAGVTKLSLDKKIQHNLSPRKVALLKLKLREAQKSGT